MKTILFFIIMVCGMHVVIAGRHVPIETFKDSGYYEHQFSNGILKIQRIRQDDGLSAPYIYHVRLHDLNLSVRMVNADGSESPQRIYKIRNHKMQGEIKDLTAEDYVLALLKGEHTCNVSTNTSSYKLENTLQPWEIKQKKGHEKAEWSKLYASLNVTESEEMNKISSTSYLYFIFLFMLVAVLQSIFILIVMEDGFPHIKKFVSFKGIFPILISIPLITWFAEPALSYSILIYSLPLGSVIGFAISLYRKIKAAKAKKALA